MEIWINQEKIDFALSGEKNLADIIVSLEEWVKKSQLIFYNVTVNEQEIVDFHNQKITEKCLVEDISKLDVTVLSEVAYTVQVLKDIKLHLTYFQNLSDNSFLLKTSTLIGYLDFFKKVFVYAEAILSMEKEFLASKALLKNLEIAFFKAKKQEQKYSESKISETASSLIALLSENNFKFNLAIMRSFLKQNDYPLAHLLENSIFFLEELDNYLEECASSFQKNQTYLALQKLIDSTNGLELVIFIINKLQKDELDNAKSIKEKLDQSSQGLSDFLNIVKEALERKDYIEISDILEYEIKEILPSIKEGFISLLKKISNLSPK